MSLVRLDPFRDLFPLADVDLQDHIQPLLEKYGVSAYLSGHYHALEHNHKNGVDYFVSGQQAASFLFLHATFRFSSTKLTFSVADCLQALDLNCR